MADIYRYYLKRETAAQDNVMKRFHILLVDDEELLTRVWGPEYRDDVQLLRA